MKLDATSILLAACCCFTLALASCSLHAGSAAAKPPALSPKPVVPAPVQVETAAQGPVSVPQTQVKLPTPQPIQAEALATILPDSPPAPEPVNPATRPPRPAPRSEPRPPATVAAQPAGPEVPPPVTAPASRRLRPVESPAERQRLLAGITARQQRVQDVLAKVKNRQLSDAEKSAVERIQAFLDQTNTALKDQDLQQAEALSNRALLLCQELSPDK